MKNILNTLFNPSKNNLKERYEENKMIFYDNTDASKWSNGLSEWKVKGQDTKEPIVIQQPKDMSCSDFEKLITSTFKSYKKGETNKTYTSTAECLKPTTKETYTCQEQSAYDFETSLIIDKIKYLSVSSKEMFYNKIKYPYFEILKSKITKDSAPFLNSLLELITSILTLKNNKESSSNIDYELITEGDNAQILTNETEEIKKVIDNVCNLILENKPINDILLEFLKIFCVKYDNNKNDPTIGFYHYLVDKINYIETMNTLTKSNKSLNKIKTITKGSNVVIYDPNNANSPSEFTSSCVKDSKYNIIVSGDNYLSWNNIDKTKVIYLNKSAYHEVPNRCITEPKCTKYNSKSGNVALYEPDGKNITFEVVDLCNLVLNPKKINCGARLANRIFYTDGRPGMFVPSYAYNKKYPDNLQIGLLPAFYANFSTPDQNPITITIKGIRIKRSNNATDYYILLPESTTKKDQSFKIQVNRLKYGSTNFNKKQDIYPLLHGDSDWNDATYKNILDSWLKSELGNKNITTNSYTSVGIVPFTDNINLPEVQTEKCVGTSDEYPIKISFSPSCPREKQDEFENIIKSNIKLWVNISVVSHTFDLHTGVNLDHKYQGNGMAHLMNNSSDITNNTTRLNGFKGNPIRDVKKDKRFYKLDGDKKSEPAGNDICRVSQGEQFDWNTNMFQDIKVSRGRKCAVEGSTWNLNNSLNAVSTLQFDYIKTNDSTTQYEICNFKNYSNNNFMIKSRDTGNSKEYYDNFAKQVLGYHTVNNYQDVKSIGKYNVENKPNEKRNKIFPYNPLYTTINSDFKYNDSKPKLLDWYNIKSYTLNEDFTIKDGEYLKNIRDNFNEIFVKFGQETFDEISNILSSSKNYFLPHIVETEFKDIKGTFTEQSILPPGVFSNENIFTQEYHNPINGFIIEYNNGAVKKISDNLIFKPNQGCYELTLNIPRIPTDDINKIKNNDSYELKLRLRDKNNTDLKDGGYTTIIDELPLLTLENTTDHFYYGLKDYVLEYQSQGEGIKNEIMKIESLETSRNRSRYIKINVNIIKVSGTVGSIKCKKYDTY